MGQDDGMERKVVESLCPAARRNGTAADYNGLYFIVWQSTDRHNSRTNNDCAPSHLTQPNVQR